MSRAAKAVWGPACWTFLHAAAAACEDVEAFGALLAAVQKTLPCPDCRAHMAAYLREKPLREGEAKAAEAASLYVFEMHNHVNTTLGKDTASALALKQLYGAALPGRRARAAAPFRRF